MEADLEERPAATLTQRCEYLRSAVRLRVSESTVSRPLRRLGWTRKKHQVGAGERDRWLRAAWRALVAGQIDAKRLVFVEEMGSNTSLFSLYAYSALQ